MTEELTKREFLGTLGAGAAATLAGCGSIGGGDEETTGGDTLDVLERDLEATEEELNKKEDEYIRSDVTQVDDLLSDGEDVRVGGDGSVSEDAVGTEGELGDDTIRDPEYILSLGGGPTIKRIVDGNGNGLGTEQTFTSFDYSSGVDPSLEEALKSVSENLDSVEEDVKPKEYFDTEDDFKAATAAVDEMEGLDVYAATTLVTEQPTARPDSVRELRGQVEKELKDKSEVYQDIALLGQDMVGVQDNLSGSDGERAQEISDNAEDLISRQSNVTEAVASDIARLSVVYGALDNAVERSQEIFENSESYSHIESVEVDGENYEAIRLVEVDDWSDMDDESAAVDNNYFQNVASKDFFSEGTEVDDLLAVYGDLSAGEGFYLVSDEGGFTEAGPFEREDYVDIQDGSYDGNIEA